MDNQHNASVLIDRVRSDAWDLAVRHVIDAQAAAKRFQKHEVQTISLAHGEGKATIKQVFAAEEACAVLDQAHHEAVISLLATRAPTLADLVRKIEIAQSDDVFLDDPNTAIEAVLTDLRFFAGGA